jgi:magnesium chelatase accessory protein
MLGKMVKPDWDREGRNWPNRRFSRFLTAGGMRWHVQVMGSGPTLMLLHGSGAATHSWRDVAPILARDFTVIAPDLPGHGFSETPSGDGLSLPGMARRLGRLLDILETRPRLVVGHSAGAAIALRMQLDGRLGPSRLVSLNGALQPFPGISGHIFPAMAKLLFLNPFAIELFAMRARQPDAIARLIESTGSKIDPAGLEDYKRLLQTNGHIAGALGMMASWDLRPLVADLPKLSVPLTLIAADNDRAVPPRVADSIKALLPRSRLIRLPDLGHLAHEEAPGRVAEIVHHAALDA